MLTAREFTTLAISTVISFLLFSCVDTEDFDEAPDEAETAQSLVKAPICEVLPNGCGFNWSPEGSSKLRISWDTAWFIIDAGDGCATSLAVALRTRHWVPALFALGTCVNVVLKIKESNAAHCLYSGPIYKYGLARNRDCRCNDYCRSTFNRAENGRPAAAFGRVGTSVPQVGCACYDRNGVNIHTGRTPGGPWRR